MADNKVVRCPGCFKLCQISAHESRVLYPNGVVGNMYLPKIGGNVITACSLESGRIIKPKFAYPVDAIVFARDVLCAKCDSYKGR
ncbi:MAG: hypothetical protein IJY77_00335 [Alphaproteobacteria bacterium]|nr:hypothetical protein [Alphaproteobacteria bacterium]